MRELIIYFGEKNDSPLGWGATADTIKCDMPDNFDLNAFLSSKWANIKLPNGMKYVNTDNILWVDIVDKK